MAFYPGVTNAWETLEKPYVWSKCLLAADAEGTVTDVTETPMLKIVKAFSLAGCLVRGAVVLGREGVNLF